MTNRPSDVQPALPLPNPECWLTLADAADLLGLSRQAVYAMTVNGVLTVYEIGEANTRPTRLYWRPEVVQLARARQLARGPLRG